MKDIGVRTTDEFYFLFKCGILTPKIARQEADYLILLNERMQRLSEETAFEMLADYLPEEAGV